MPTNSEILSAFGLKPGDRVLFDDAHPDDTEMRGAQTILALQAAGVIVDVAIATNGTKSTLGNRWFVKFGGRRLETWLALWQLGVPAGRVRFLQDSPDQLNDGELSTWPNRLLLAKRLANLMIQNSYDAVFTPGAEGFDGHDDHVAVHQASLAAVVTASVVTQKPPIAVWASSPQIDSHVALPVNADLKLDALSWHYSQFPMQPLPGHGELIVKGSFCGDQHIPANTLEYLNGYQSYLQAEGWQQVNTKLY